MIDLQSEKPITIEAARTLKFFVRAGRVPSISTIYRWISSGCRGHILETVLITGRQFTTEQAVLRFLSKLSGGQVRTSPPRQRQRQIDRAERELEAAGV